ncbi:MAG: hypothetical protein HKM02_03895 [Pseudomonadales bacterium]|nr:hypothetical protein [Pseudomonadales bacterium]
MMNLTYGALVRWILVLLTLELCWILVFPPQLAGMSQQKDYKTDWSLSKPRKISPDKALAIINQRNLWGLSSSVMANSTHTLSLQASNPLTWKILGTEIHGDQSEVLLQVDDKPIDFLIRGDKLPGGQKIMGIYQDHLNLLLQNRTKVTLYFPDDIKPNELSLP